MRKIFDFKCPNGHVSEEFVEADAAVRCKCGLESKRIISPIRCKLEHISGDFPGATMKWIKEHEKGARVTSE